MAKTISTAADGDNRVTYTFTVVVEPDEDAWHAYCPALQGYGAATWGASREEALRHIHEVVGMVVAELVEDGEDLPADVDVVAHRARTDRRSDSRRLFAPTPVRQP